MENEKLEKNMKSYKKIQRFIGITDLLQQKSA